MQSHKSKAQKVRQTTATRISTTETAEFKIEDTNQQLDVQRQLFNYMLKQPSNESNDNVKNAVHHSTTHLSQVKHVSEFRINDTL